MKQLFFAVFAVTISVCYSDALNCGRPLCNNISEINKYPVEEDPTQYYQCVTENVSIKRRCGLSLYFDYFTQDCVDPSEWEDVCESELETTTIPDETTTVEAPTCRRPLCLTVDDKLFPVKYEATKYYQCVAPFVSVKRTCSSSLYFDYFSQICVDPSDWEDVCESEPETTTIPEETTTVEALSCIRPLCLTVDIELLPVKNEPTKYYQCVAPLVSVKRTCPTSLYFDYFSQKCVFPNQWEDVCESDIETTTVPQETTTMPAPTCERPLCHSINEKRLFPIRFDPTSYYQCVAPLVSVKRQCHDFLYFDYGAQLCVSFNEWTNVCKF